VAVSGNLKFDVRTVEEAAATRLIRELAAGPEPGPEAGLRLVVAGSTLDGEEAILLEAWRVVLSSEPDLALVLAPRHPERFGAVAELLARSGFRWRRRSSIGTAQIVPGEIVLLDSIGELASVYSLASVAFVGGSLIPAGGHNPLEPAQFGVPVVMGEHYVNFRSIVEAMLAREAVVIARPDALAGAVASVLGDSAAAREIGERGRTVFEEQAGATRRSVAAIKDVLIAEGSK
jgi:3-deoxy-D-manno-octulosonic-acid transferase